MAIIPNGILSAPAGRIGPVTCYERNGRNIIRPAHNRGIMKPTPARIVQRAKIKLCQQFTRGFTGTGFFNVTFPAYGHGGSGYNRAMSSLMNLAVTGTWPHQSLAYDKVLVSRGPLPPAQDAEVSLSDEGNLHFSWTDNSGEGTAREDDTVILVAYAVTTGAAIFSLDAGMRHDGEAILKGASPAAQPLAAWITFINRHGDVADSVYAGMLEYQDVLHRCR